MGIEELKCFCVLYEGVVKRVGPSWQHLAKKQGKVGGEGSGACTCVFMMA